MIDTSTQFCVNLWKWPVSDRGSFRQIPRAEVRPGISLKWMRPTKIATFFFSRGHNWVSLGALKIHTVSPECTHWLKKKKKKLCGSYGTIHFNNSQWQQCHSWSTFWRSSKSRSFPTHRPPYLDSNLAPHHSKFPTAQYKPASFCLRTCVISPQARDGELRRWRVEMWRRGYALKGWLVARRARI